MSSTLLTLARPREGLASRVADYVELTKPRIALLVLVAVAVSACVSQWGIVLHPLNLVHTLLGTLLVAASASAMNQWLERHRDARMPRTADRPLPAGRLSSFEVLTFAAISIVAGFLYLFAAVGWLTALLGLATWVLYVWVYTPLKSRTSLNTLVGAIPGAMPILIGWSATGAAFDLRAVALFTILFLWQFPHFMAIAWIYRDQYRQGGMKMLPVVDPTGRSAGLQAVIAALALLPVSLIPGLFTPSSSVYLVAALALGIGQLICALLFYRRLDDAAARRLLRASLIYLPALLLLLMLIPFV